MKGQLHMPTYEYACKSCGEHLEVVQSFKDNALTECPACGGTLRKVFGNIGITFKGSGFYITDYRSEGYKNQAKADSGESKSESKDLSKTETKSDSKPATEAAPAKTETKAESKPAPKAESKSASKSSESSKPSKS